MGLNDSEGLEQEIDKMLDKVEQKIRQVKELNRPALDALDKQEIEQRLITLEQRDESDKKAMQAQLTSLESQLNLLNQRLYIVMLVLLVICGLFALFSDLV
ncbi:hypothetical protein [Crocosphaera chwakensis]|uniref:Uncharacterized protein n=1 Tax=Crocosphaera chwakensis CCY0110 TaxID=391612 RepID=A3IU05_9CHRO|nr:hypothetical protein [Crocosphaera chwakensis]EAZ90100.1 hypothetical protein CY0110_15180 [Crocosphaera chwakensis CCY0110]